MELKSLKIHNICTICVKSMDLAVIWPNKFLSGEFRGKMVIIRSNLWVTQLLGRINSFLENFVFFLENGHLCLWVSPWKFDDNKMWQDEIRTICIIDWLVSFR